MKQKELLWIDGIGVPVTLESNVQELHRQVFQKDDYQVSPTVKTISDAIIQKTGYGE